MANRYVYHSRISDAKFRRILRLFALDLNAVQIAALTRLSRVSINRHLTALRRRMARLCEQAAPMSGDRAFSYLLERNRLTITPNRPAPPGGFLCPAPPTGARNVETGVALQVIVMHFHFGVDQFGRHAQRFPHAGHGDGNALVVLIGVVSQG
ncbi:MAG: hypothetical protein OXU71_09960 [Gammaproteobacteria bacterium]|nr:hypothetical protein [Gammaproteobacteria bacterium]